MQVAEEDTHDNYLICRGFDTRIGKFIDYEAGNADKPGIPVAKPYGGRGKRTYSVGEVHQAFLALLRIGQNPGVAETTVGHPANLDEEVELLSTDDNVYINWILGGESPSKVYLAESPVGGIPAMSGSTPGSASCKLKYINSSGVIEDALDYASNYRYETIYNVATSAVAASTIIQAKEEAIGGKLVVDFEDC